MRVSRKKVTNANSYPILGSFQERKEWRENQWIHSSYGENRGYKNGGAVRESAWKKSKVVRIMPRKHNKTRGK